MDPDYFDFDSKHACHISRVPVFIFEQDDKESLDKAQLKELLYEEIISFVPSI